MEPHKVFGQSQKFIDSLKMEKEYPMDEMLNEAVTLASCSYEENTEWGKKASFCFKHVITVGLRDLNILQRKCCDEVGRKEIQTY